MLTHAPRQATVSLTFDVRQKKPMNPTVTRFDDSAEPDEDGLRDYVYVGTLYDFSDGVDRGYIIRVYDDTPDEASFLSSYVLIGKEKIRKSISQIPYDDTFFQSVIKHLDRHMNFTKIKALTSCSGGYEIVKI
jgi:hypothetical protein